MRVNCKNLSVHEVLKLIQDNYEEFADADLELHDLSDEAAIKLAKRLPGWVQSVRLNSVAVENSFAKNIAPNRLSLIQRIKNLEKKTLQPEEEPSAKKPREDTQESLNPLRGGLTTTDHLSNLLSVINDITFLGRIAGIGRKQRWFAYLRILQLKNQESHERQWEMLSTFIKDSYTWLDQPSITAALITYRHREDIPPENRILAIGCLVIRAILNNDNDEFQKKLQELFVFSIPYPNLFITLCCYIYSYKGEISKCNDMELIKHIRPESTYLKFNVRIPAKNTYAYLSNLVLEEETHILSASKDGHQSVYPNSIYFQELAAYPDLARRYANIFLQRTKDLQAAKKLDRKFSFVDNWGSAASVTQVFLPKTCEQDPDYVAICYFINNVAKSSALTIILRSFSEEMKQKILTVLFEGLDEILNSLYYSIDDKGAIIEAQDRSSSDFPFITHIAPMAHPPVQVAYLPFYFFVMNTLKAKENFIAFIKKQLIKLIDNTVFEEHILRWITVIRDFGVTGYFLSELMQLQSKIIEDEQKRFDILKLIADHYVQCSQSDPKLLDELIKRIFSMIMGKYQVYECVAGKSQKIVIDKNKDDHEDAEDNASEQEDEESEEPDLSVFGEDKEEDDIDIILDLKELCLNHPIMVDVKVKQDIFQLLTSMNYVLEGDLLLMVLHCCFKKEEDFIKFLRDEILKDEKTDVPRLVLEAELFTKRNKWAAIALIVLAPYMQIEAIEKYFAQLNRLVNHLLDHKIELEKLQDYQKYLNVFVLAIINLLFFISPKTRELYLSSLSEDKKNLLCHLSGFKDRDRLSASTLNKIYEDEELLHLHPYYLKHFDHNGGFNLDFVHTMKIGIERKILAKLYEKNINFDSSCVTQGYVIRDDPEATNGIILHRSAAIMSRCVNIDERKAPENTSKLLQEFELAISKESSSDFQRLKEIFNAVAMPFEALPVNIRLFNVACFSHNPECLQYVIKQYQVLGDHEKQLFKVQMEHQLLQFKQNGYNLCGRILQIIQDQFPDFTQESELSQLPMMQIG